MRVRVLWVASPLIAILPFLPLVPLHIGLLIRHLKLHRSLYLTGSTIPVLLLNGPKLGFNGSYTTPSPFFFAGHSEW